MPDRNNQRGMQPNPGDYTAMEKMKQEEAHAEEVAEADRRMGIASERTARMVAQGIFDPRDGSAIDGPELLDDEDGDDDLDLGGVIDADEARIDGPPLPPGTGPSRQPARRKDKVLESQASSVGTVELLDEEEEQEQEYRTGRVNMDIESMTYGIGNTFNFKRGLRYRMPKEVYEHLDERGYIAH